MKRELGALWNVANEIESWLPQPKDARHRHLGVCHRDCGMHTDVASLYV